MSAKERAKNVNWFFKFYCVKGIEYHLPAIKSLIELYRNIIDCRWECFQLSRQWRIFNGSKTVKLGLFLTKLPIEHIFFIICVGETKEGYRISDIEYLHPKCVSD